MALNRFYLQIAQAFVLIGLGGIVGFATGFFVNQPQEQTSQQIIREIQKPDFKELQATVNSFNKIEQAFSELFVKYEVLSKTKNPPDNVDSLNKLKKEFLSRFDILESYIKSSSDNTNKEPVQHQADIQSENCEQIYAQVDPAEIQGAIADMYSADIDTRQRALRALTLIGSSEIKQQIGQLIFNS